LVSDSGYRIPITDEIVLITSIPFEIDGRTSRTFLSFSGKTLFDAILLLNFDSSYAVGRDLKRRR